MFEFCIQLIKRHDRYIDKLYWSQVPKWEIAAIAWINGVWGRLMWCDCRNSWKWLPVGYNYLNCANLDENNMPIMIKIHTGLVPLRCTIQAHCTVIVSMLCGYDSIHTCSKESKASWDALWDHYKIITGNRALKGKWSINDKRKRKSTRWM